MNRRSRYSRTTDFGKEPVIDGTQPSPAVRTSDLRADFREVVRRRQDDASGMHDPQLSGYQLIEFSSVSLESSKASFFFGYQ